jgi:hypothetical protein
MGLRDALHHKPDEPVDPNKPHAFKRAGDAWITDGVPPSSTVGAPGNSTAGAVIAGLQFGDQHCVVCRRGHDDPIHAPAD